MIGIGLSLMRRRGTSPLAAYAVGGVVPVLVLDFESQRFLGAASSVVRASAKTVLDAAGNLVTVAADTPAYDWGSGRRALLLETSATRLNGYVTMKSSFGMTAFGGAVLTDLAGAGLGMFPGLRIASAGTVGDRAGTTISVTSGQAYAFKALWAPGTSPNVLFRFRNTSASTQSDFGGPVAAPTALTSAAGTLTLLESRTRGGLRETVLLFTPNFTGTCSIGFGPYSATAGETVTGYAWQIEQGSFDSSWILGDAGAAVVRAADIFTSVALSAADFAAGLAVRLAAQVRAGAVTNPRLVQTDTGTDQTSQRLTWVTATSKITSLDYEASALQCSLPLGGAEGVDFKAAASFAANAFRGALGGVAATADTAGSYTAPQLLRLGLGPTGAFAPASLRLYALSLFAQPMTDAQLIGATT